ncbi:MAG: hypothetical protein MZV63_66115 [Marinilabiliales bacterium]|nr:hypothetical protein [Marinilabiliales bacterium]
MGNRYRVPHLTGVGVEVEVGRPVGAAGEHLEGDGADHGRVVGAELRRGDVGVDPGVAGEALEARPQPRVPGDAAAQDERPRLDPVRRRPHLSDERPGNDLLEAGQEIAQARIVLGDAALPDDLQRGRFEPAEAEIEAPVLRPGHGEGEGLGVAALAQLFDHRPAGIAEAEELGDLVERLPRGVVARPAEELVRKRLVHLIEGRVSARDEKPQHGIGDGGILEEAGLEVGIEVVDADEGFLVIVGQALGERETDEKRADEPGALGHGEEIDLPQAGVGPGQRLSDDRRDRLDVLPRSQLRERPPRTARGPRPGTGRCC